jgi:hypothetical protein
LDASQQEVVAQRGGIAKSGSDIMVYVACDPSCPGLSMVVVTVLLASLALGRSQVARAVLTADMALPGEHDTARSFDLNRCE